ncbi:MAG TPA: hypothetical protein VGM43_18920, partial [Bryobacteraceae bacterium]
MRRISSTLFALLLFTGASDARVVKLVIEHTQPTGPYTRITGHFEGELDPKLPQNAIIQDLKLAPRNARGRVEYSATFTLLFPTDPAKRSGVLLYEVPNRGNSPLNARLSEDEQNEGDAMLSSGWQGDLTPRPNLETITVPVAKNADGSSIAGPVLMSLMNLPAASSTASLESGFAGLRYQRPVSLDTAKAQLTRQASEDGE